MSLKAAPTLAKQHTLALVLSFVTLQLVVMALLVGGVVWPMAKRSANDLAGLVVLAAQTWAELPPDTRPAFEAELARSHQLAVRPLAELFELSGRNGLNLADKLAEGAAEEMHPPFVSAFEAAMSHRMGRSIHVTRLPGLMANTDWYWVAMSGLAPDGKQGQGQSLAVGWSHDRIDSQPMAVAVFGFWVSLGLAWGVARWLARRLTTPLARLADAMPAVGHGEAPSPLPIEGPQELRTLAERFNAMATQVQDLLSARTHLLAGVSHDLRTPLTRMRLALEMAREHPSPTVLDRLERDITHMNDLIGQLLALSQGLQAEPALDVALAPWLQALAADYAHAEAPVRVSFEPEGAMGQPSTESGRTDHGTCRVPPLALRRAMGNLIDNALRYAPGQPVDVVLKLQDGSLRVGVLDRGPGIAQADRARVLAPFVRLEPSRNRKTGGVGLGLSIVAALAQAHGWTLTLDEREGGGLAVWLTLPG